MAKDAPDNALDLARAISSGGNPLEQLTRWARDATRAERRAAFIKARAERKDAPMTAEAAGAAFDTLEG